MLQIVVPQEEPYDPRASPLSCTSATRIMAEQTPSAHLRYRGGTPESPKFDRGGKRTPQRSQRDETAVRGASIAAVGCSLLLASFLLLTATGTMNAGLAGKGDGGRRHEIHLQPQPQHHQLTESATSQLEFAIRQEQVRPRDARNCLCNCIVLHFPGRLRATDDGIGRQWCAHDDRVPDGFVGGHPR